MADLHQTSNPNHNSGIDAVGWWFVAFSAAIIALAALIAYQGNETKIASASVPHLVAR
jgi:hypothetical protein